MSVPHNTPLWFWKCITEGDYCYKSTLDEEDFEIHCSVWNKYSTQIILEDNQSLLSAQNIPFYMWNIVLMEAYKKLNLLDT